MFTVHTGYNKLRLYALLLTSVLSSVFLSPVANAAFVKYDWAGYIGGGNFTTLPISPRDSDFLNPDFALGFNVSVIVDLQEAAPLLEVPGSHSDTGGPLLEYDYTLISSSITIGSELTQISNRKFSIGDNSGLAQWDVLNYQALVSYNDVLTFFTTSIYLAGSTFEMEDLAVPPLFDPALAESSVRSSNGITTTITLAGTAATAQVVPVPAAIWLFGSALLGLVGLRRKH